MANIIITRIALFYYWYYSSHFSHCITDFKLSVVMAYILLEKSKNPWYRGRYS